jgi:uncharacterized protein YjiS (DUF1127 family)
VLTLPSTLLRLFRQWRQRTADRRHLSELEDHVLADFGLTRQQVMEEAAKPFWRPLDPGSARRSSRAAPPAAGRRDGRG